MINCSPIADSASAHALAVRALEAEFGDLFLRMRRLYIQVAHRVHPDLVPGQYKVFSTIGRRGPLTASALGEAMQTDKAQMSRALRELESMGLITRTPDPTDRRANLIALSTVGEQKLAEAHAPTTNDLLTPLAQWDVESIDSFTALLHALIAGDPPPPRENPATRAPAT